METTLTLPPPTEARTVDVTGLPPEAVRVIESVVAFYRDPADPHAKAGVRPTFDREVNPSPEEFARALRELASGSPTRSLPDDFSRADIYDDHD